MRRGLYPYVESDCISFGKCVKVCSQINSIQGKVNIEQEAYAAISKNHNIWRKSASGGAFAEICNIWGNQNAIIYGAGWNDFRVNYMRVTYDNLEQVLCSKYIDSDMLSCYTKVKTDLLKKEYVVFCGTPCQVADLRAYLNNEYDIFYLLTLYATAQEVQRSLVIVYQYWKISLRKK